MSVLLKLENISYQQAGFQLLDNIDFYVLRGEIVGLVGINGAGKSTTLKIATRLLSPDTGQVICDASTTVGYAPEIPPQITHWSVKQFLTHVCYLHGIPRQKHVNAIAHVCDVCSLNEILYKTCSTLSKGNQQRVNLAQALLHNPDVLIVDEPTSGLDPQQIQQFRQTLLAIKDQTAIILSSHIMQEITALCDRAIVIHQGKQIGELDLSLRDQRLLVEFTQPVTAEVFQEFLPWLSGDGVRHQFISNSPADKNTILSFCLAKHLPISRVVGIEDLAERDFLSLIGREVSNA